MKYETIKWSNFSAVYDKHVGKGAALEIGVREGGSLRDLKRRCGGNIYGIDLNIKNLIDNYTMIEGDAAESETADRLKQSMLFNLDSRLAVVVDDGSHRPFDQVLAFRLYWPLVAHGGVYIIEDMHMTEKFRWKLYKWLGLPSMWTIIKELYKKQQGPYEGIKTVTRYNEIHIYPHIICIVKTKEVIKIVSQLL